MHDVLDPVLQAIVRAAVDATGASGGWMLRADPAGLRVVAAAGESAARLLGLEVPSGRGTAGFVIECGEPLALALHGDDPRFKEGVAEVVGHAPTSVLTVPCTAGDEVVGALEVVDKSGAATFSFDDAEVVTLLASVAGASLAQGAIQAPPVPDPGQVGADLQRLAASDPSRYAAVAVAVRSWLGDG